MMQEPVISLPVLCLVIKPLIMAFPEKHSRYPAWPADARQLEEDLQRHLQRLPVLVRTEQTGSYKGQKHLLLFTSTYALKLVASQKGDAYLAVNIQPLSHRDHHALARGEAVILRVQRCYLFSDFPDIPREWEGQLHNYFPHINEVYEAHQAERKRAQEAAAQPPAEPLITRAQEYLLQTLERAIELTREAQKASERSRQLIFYNAVEPVGEARYSSQDYYAFRLVAPVEGLEHGLFACLEEQPDLRGHVRELYRDPQSGLIERIVVQFEKAIDLKDLQPPQAFRTLGSEAIFRVQREAIEMLRSGGTENPHLLAALAEHRYQPYTEPTEPGPLRSRDLNEAQTLAFQRAFAIKDLLLVQGPPGTGKTHTISEIARECARRQERVLVTARTHKAVDNVLRNLPPELEILRVGQESLVAPEVKHLLIDERARELQERMLKETTEARKALEVTVGHLAEIDRYVDQSRQVVALLQQTAQHLEAIKKEYDQKRRSLDDQLTQALQSLYDRQNTAAESQRQATRDQERLNRAIAAATRRQSWPLLGAFWRWRLPRLQQRLSSLQETLWKIGRQLQHYEMEIHLLEQNRRHLDEQRPLASLKDQLAEITRRFERDQENVAQRMREIVSRLRMHLPPAELPMPPATHPGLTQALQDFAQRWSNRLRDLLLSRHQLMQDWHQTLQSRRWDLYPILLRMADVIGATCIGSATARILADVTYDLILVDEAGQISLPDLLVPLVHGRRAILVGDHQQLPPLVDTEVYRQLAALSEADAAEEETSEAADIEMLLSTSMFEILVKHVDSAHFVMLNRQYRMPASIAGFVSEQFYEGKLQTAPLHRLQRPQLEGHQLFRSPFVFIDTCEMDVCYRSESGRYINEAEARLIAEIAMHAIEGERDWRIIVPYQEQASHIRTLLQQAAIEHGLDLQALVATVDSFQGGESDLVLYGFTRSNPRHAIGFLGDHRRLNVALTRAREQLILIGDSSTLLGAMSAGRPDVAFQSLMKALLEHARRQGEYLSFRECRRRLSRGGLTAG
jgi:flagellar hook-basal body complex protein FliE